MDVNDGAEILSRLGILDSREESPARIAQRTKDDQFVQININDLSDSDSGDDTVFDRNALMGSNDRSPQVRGCCVVAESSVFSLFIVAFAVFSTGYTINYAPDIFKFIGTQMFPSNFAFQSMGLVVGVFTGEFLVSRLYLSNVISLCLLLLLLVSMWSYNVVPLAVLFFIQGSASSVILYSAYSISFVYWRMSRRVLICLFVCFSLGSFTSSVHSPISLSDHNDFRFKRDVDQFLVNTTVKPKKPEVAQGILNLDTKTKENEERRKNSDVSSAQNISTIATTLSTTTETTPKPTTKPTTTTTSTTTSTSTTTTSPTTASFASLPTTVKAIPTAKRPLSPVVAVNSDTAGYGSVVVLSISLFFFFLVAIFSCRCRFLPDSRVSRLLDDNSPELSSSLRLRLGVCQCLLGLIHTMCVYESARDGHRFQVEASTLILFIFAAIIGPMVISQAGSVCLLLFVVGSSLLLQLSLLPLSIVHPCIASSCSLLLLYLPFLIELRLSPRPSLVLQHLLLFPSLGRFLSVIPILYSLPAHSVTLLVSLTCLLLFVTLARSMNRAERLRVSMAEYSHPVDTQPDEEDAL